MAGNGRNASDCHRHSRPAAPMDRRRRVLLAVFAILVTCAVAAVLVLTLLDRSSTSGAEAPVASTSTVPSSLPSTISAPMTTNPATSSEVVPPTFAAAMGRIGISLDPHTGWIVAQGICVRLRQPEYDQFRLAEGVERLFPRVSDARAHAFVAMVATSVCHR
jgi:hypothetical protein